MAASSRKMSYSFLNSTLNYLTRHSIWKSQNTRALSSSKGLDSKSVDPFNVYRSSVVQKILRKITGFDVEKVSSTIPPKLRKPKYKLFTNEELNEAKQEAEKAAYSKLQMPPFMAARKPIEHVFSKDPELEGLDNSKYAFIDISFGLSNKERLIAVRDVDGTLRKANWEERDRFNQVYNGIPGQTYVAPKMFEPEHLERVLKDGKHMYILDRACAQYEPDNPEYIRVTQRTYEHINTHRNYEILRSTRHFGPMAFYLTWYKRIDSLVIEMIQSNLIEDSIDLIKLYALVHPSSKTAGKIKDLHNLDIVKTFCQNDAEQKSELELTIQSYEESLRTEAAQAQ